MKVRFGMLVAALAVVAFGWVSSARPSSAGVTSSYVKFDLVGPEISEKVPRGSAKFIANAFDTRFLVTIYRTWLTQGDELTVFVNDGTADTELGSFNVTAFHSGRLFLSEDLNAIIPDIDATWTVRIEDANGDVILSGQPTAYKYFQMYGKVSGPLLGGTLPTGRITFKHSDWGYSRSLRVFIQNIKLPEGTVLDLYRNAAAMDVQCTVSAVGFCIVRTPLHDDDPVHILTADSNVYVKQTWDHDGDPPNPDVTRTIATLPAANWVQVVPVPAP